jgi:dolichol kinase
MTAFKSELHRKLLHIGCLWIVGVYYFLGFNTIVNSLIFIICLVISIDFGRQLKGILGDFCRFVLTKLKVNKIIRDKEQYGITGASKMMVIAFLVLYLLPANLYYLAISVLVLADAVAALVGIKYGETVIWGKTLEGSVAFMATAIILSLFWWYVLDETYLYLMIGMTCGLIAAIFELSSKKLNVDDNLLIPVAYIFGTWAFAVKFQEVSQAVKPW